MLGLVGSMARARGVAVSGRPALAALQLPPPSRLLYTPLVPTYTVLGVVGSTASEIAAG